MTGVTRAMFDRLRRVAKGESGMAMMTTVMVMAVLTGFGVTISMVSINNSQNAGRDRQAGEALNLAEGGVAQAVEYIRGYGVSALTCFETTYATNPSDPSCENAAPWGNPNPAKSQRVVFGPHQHYRVWIGAIQAPSLLTNFVGRYRVHSEGLSGGGPGARRIEVDLSVKPFSFPLGIFGDDITAGGNIVVTNESIFAKNCVNQREKIRFGSALDIAHGIPPAVHSAQYINYATNGCSANDRTNIHDPKPRGSGVCYSGSPPISHAQFDQDRLGGPLAGTPCAGAGGAYPQTSLFDETALKSYGYQAGGLSKAEYDALRSRAVSMGTYFKTPVNPGLTEAWAVENPNAVLFYDLSNTGGTVSLQQSDIPGFNSTQCGRRSIVIVVLNGDLDFNGGVDVVGSLFVPQGTIKGNGGAKLIGTVFARRLDSITGGFDSSLQSCFFDAFPGGLYNVTPSRFAEVDR